MIKYLLPLCLLCILHSCRKTTRPEGTSNTYSAIDNLIAQMTIEEKIGQLTQINGDYGNISDQLKDAIQRGKIGSIINEVDPETINKLQEIAKNESRLGIPLLIGRDVIHGFKTIFPIPIGLAATWDTSICRRSAQIAASEAASIGINWTFAPMVDICRDPRWGRIAESLGEDPHLAGALGKALVSGFQGDDLSAPSTIAACAKHFVGYGAAEGGRDYNTAHIPEVELRNTYLPPFQSCIEAGVSSFMVGFNDLNGIPCSGNRSLVTGILKDEWGFTGVVVSDWESIPQMINHGVAANGKNAAALGLKAGVDIDMVSNVYAGFLPELIQNDEISEKDIDNAVRAVLNLKYKLGLFENTDTMPFDFPKLANEKYQQVAKEAALKSCVLLKNDQGILPLDPQKKLRILIVGPMADDAYEQMGTWIFDGEEKYSTSILKAMQEGKQHNAEITFLAVMDYSRDTILHDLKKLKIEAQNTDVILAFVGEESILSGEAHCRADLHLPGMQRELMEILHQTGKPLITTILAGRPLTIANELQYSDALIYAWHPGNMGGPALVDLLFGLENPSGKLPLTFPTQVGQIPIYYNHKNTGKPASESSFVHINDIPRRAVQYSLGNTSHYLDAGYKPLFPFGFGLSYTSYSYSALTISKDTINATDSFELSITVTNTGERKGEETVQVYIRDAVSSVSRPVKELIRFSKVSLNPSESKKVSFQLKPKDLSFYYPQIGRKTESGKFEFFVGSNSTTTLSTSVYLK